MRDFDVTWEKRSLASLAHFINGYSFGPSDWGENGTPIIRIRELLDPGIEPDKHKGDLPGDFRIDDGSLVFSWSATLVAVVWNRGPAYLNQHLFKVVPYAGVDGNFLCYSINASIDRIVASAHGTTMRHIKRRDLQRHYIRLPSLGEQRRIAETLSAVDTSIQAAEQLIAKHQAARRGVLDDLFSERGSWPHAALKFFLTASPKNGFSPSEVDDWTGVRVLGLGCLTDDGFAPRQLKNVSSINLGVRSALLEDGDLLMTRANTRDLVGFVGRYQDVGGPCLYPDLMMRLRPNQKIIPSFLEYSLRHSYVRRQIMAHAVGTSESMVKISSAIVRNLSVAVPSLEEQQRIVSIIEAHDERIAAERARLEKLRQLKAGLMDDLLTGRVRVDELEDLPV